MCNFWALNSILKHILAVWTGTPNSCIQFHCISHVQRVFISIRYSSFIQSVLKSWQLKLLRLDVTYPLSIYHGLGPSPNDNVMQLSKTEFSYDMVIFFFTERQHNFKKYTYGTIKSGNSGYDYLSVMHYGRTAFGKGKVTIDAKRNEYDRKIGQRSGFSREDISQVRTKYQCWFEYQRLHLKIIQWKLNLN